MDADISYVIRYLQAFSKEKYEALLRRHPESHLLLKANGVSLGDADTAVAIDAVNTMLESVDTITASAISDTLNKLRANRRLKFIGSILTFLTAGGVVGSIIGLDEMFIAVALGAIGILGSLVMLLTRWLKGGVSGSSSLDQAFDKLRKHCLDARVLKAKLKDEIPSLELEKIIFESNSIAREICMVLGGLGYDLNLA